jgi:tetratricopeptide (TPR) repeat protein
VHLLEESDRCAEAEPILREALDLYAKFVARLPEDVAYQETAARISGILSDVLKGGGERRNREESYRRALELSAQVLARFPDRARSWSHLAYWHGSLGSILSAKGQLRDAQEAFRQASGHYRAALERDGNHVGSLNNLAWMMATCPEEQFRDAGAAVELAKKAAALAPAAAYVWNTLGLAHYHAGEWKAAIEALDKSMTLYAGKPEWRTLESFNTFFLAMAHWQMGDKRAAHQWYDRGVRWMEKHQPKDEELLRFRAEAAKLLGIEETPKS